MTCNLRALNVTSREDAERELREMGVVTSDMDSASDKMIHINVKLENVEWRSTDLLKQGMVSAGGEVICAERTVENGNESTDVILVGSYDRFKKLLEDIRSESPGSGELRYEIQKFIDNLLRDDFIIQCKNVSLDLRRRTHIMGIVNVTPDSFSDGGLFFDPDNAYAHALELIDQGADIIDIGGETTRPGSKPIAAEEEIDRVIPVIERLAGKTHIPISIDTYKAHVAETAIKAGAEMINDISGLRFDFRMAETAARHNVPIILMHIRGTPEDMQHNLHYESLLSEILQYLRNSMSLAQEAGIHMSNIIVDPGIGFGKSIDEGHNLKILNKLSEFKSLGRPILVGPSRKAFIGKILDADETEREEGTAAAVSAAVLNGAHIVRVHNVGMIRKVVRVIDAIKKEN